jgi:hypothetical protein
MFEPALFPTLLVDMVTVTMWASSHYKCSSSSLLLFSISILFFQHQQQHHSTQTQTQTQTASPISHRLLAASKASRTVQSSTNATTPSRPLTITTSTTPKRSLPPPKTPQRAASVYADVGQLISITVANMFTDVP